MNNDSDVEEDKFYKCKRWGTLTDMENEKKQLFDVTIIGGGPVGLFTAFYAGMRDMSVHIIESLPELGGQLTALYPEKYIYDVAAFPKIKAEDLVRKLLAQLKSFQPAITLGEEVQCVERHNDHTFMLKTNKRTYYSKTIVITAGNGAFQPRKLQLENEEKFANKNLHYYVKNIERFSNKDILIFGGGDSAVDWALTLEPHANKVYLAHRRNEFRAHEASVKKLKRSSVHILTPYVANKLEGQSKVERVVLKKVREDIFTTIDVDDVIVNYGFVSTLGPIKDWGLRIERNSIVVNSKMETNIEGIYAVGDINTYEGKVKLIATGFGEAPIAVSNAKVRIDPKARLQSQHSTTLMEKKQVNL